MPQKTLIDVAENRVADYVLSQPEPCRRVEVQMSVVRTMREFVEKRGEKNTDHFYHFLAELAIEQAQDRGKIHCYHENDQWFCENPNKPEEVAPRF